MPASLQCVRERERENGGERDSNPTDSKRLFECDYSVICQLSFCFVLRANKVLLNPTIIKQNRRLKFSTQCQNSSKIKISA